MTEQMWQYRQGEQTGGPITIAQLCQLFADGKLSMDALLWTARIGKWVPKQDWSGTWTSDGDTLT